MAKKLSKKQIKKRVDKKCLFCGCNDYTLLDVHRIVYGCQGGKYKDENMVTACANCHRKIHAGKIIIYQYRNSSVGRVLHCIINGEEKFL